MKGGRALYYSVSVGGASHSGSHTGCSLQEGIFSRDFIISAGLYRVNPQRSEYMVAYQALKLIYI